VTRQPRPDDGPLPAEGPWHGVPLPDEDQPPAAPRPPRSPAHRPPGEPAPALAIAEIRPGRWSGPAADSVSEHRARRAPAPTSPPDHRRVRERRLAPAGCRQGSRTRRARGGPPKLTPWHRPHTEVWVRATQACCQSRRCLRSYARERAATPRTVKPIQQNRRSRAVRRISGCRLRRQPCQGGPAIGAHRIANQPGGRAANH